MCCTVLELRKSFEKKMKERKRERKEGDPSRKDRQCWARYKENDGRLPND